jgi:hypothetical protein
MFPASHKISFLLLILAGAVALAQTKTTDSKPQTAAAAQSKPSSTANLVASGPATRVDKSANVPMDKTVLTVHGICENGAAKFENKSGADNCKTVITKRQMEAVIDVVQATGKSILPAQRRDVAVGYVDLLTGATAAEKAGVDKDPRFAEVVRLARMKALSDLYRVRLQEEANTITPDEVEAYYKQKLPAFEELQLVHMSFPKYNSANLKDAEFEAKARKLAYDMRDRAAKGEDIDKLEKEGLDVLGVKTPPPTKMAPVRRGVYSKEQEDILFALKTGEVTKVWEQPSVYIILKLESRGTPSLADVQTEIYRKLSQAKLERLTNQVGAAVHVDYNDDYFGPRDPNAGRPMIEVPLPKQQAASPKK